VDVLGDDERDAGQCRVDSVDPSRSSRRVTAIGTRWPPGSRRTTSMAAGGPSAAEPGSPPWGCSTDRPGAFSICPAARPRSARQCASQPTTQRLVRWCAMSSVGRASARSSPTQAPGPRPTAEHRPGARQRDGLDAVKLVSCSSGEPARVADGAVHVRSGREDERLSDLQLLRRPSHAGMRIRVISGAPSKSPALRGFYVGWARPVPHPRPMMTMDVLRARG
jgi:hypothetical protein